MDYEAIRLENIQKNNDILASLGLDINVFTGPVEPTSSSQLIDKPQKKKTRKSKRSPPPASTKRDADEMNYEDDGEEDEDEDEEPTRKKAAKTGTTSARRPSMGTRRSSRTSSTKAINYAGDNFETPNSAPSLVSKKQRARKESSGSGVNMESAEFDDMDDDGEERPRHKLGKRTRNPKTFGHIPGIPVGKTWEMRMHCSTDAVHAPPVSGISGNKLAGAWSIALSGGYEDDVDLGSGFTFTGAGGRDLRGTATNRKNLRTAPQSSDQSFEHSLNAALKRSTETKKPVRVIRGYKLHSKFAPASGYRYDGLYTVEKAWMERGLKGFQVCKYALKRLPGQPPLPERRIGNAAAATSSSSSAATTDVEEGEEEEEEEDDDDEVAEGVSEKASEEDDTLAA